MHNKNGFTLVEVLAVLVVIGLLMALAIPAYANILAGVKRDTFNSKIIEIEAAANKLGDKTKDEVKNAGSACINTNVDSLIKKGYLLSESDSINVIYSPADNKPLTGVIKTCYCSNNFNIASYYTTTFDAYKVFHEGEKVTVGTKIYKCLHDYPGNNLGINATYTTKVGGTTKTLRYFEEVKC